MINKSFIALAAIASMGAATIASADHWFFATHMTQDADGTIELGAFNAPGVGVVEIYDYQLGEIGELLGSTPVTQGANSDFKIQLGMPPIGNVMAVMKVGDQVVGQEMININ